MDVFTGQEFKQADGSDPSLSITDARGNPAAVDGVPVWASSDETVVSVVASANGMSAAVKTVGLGTARVSVTADADLGSGVISIVGVSEDINVAQNPNSLASIITLNLGAAQDIP